MPSRTPTAETPTAETPIAETPIAETPIAETRTGETLTDETLADETLADEALADQAQAVTVAIQLRDAITRFNRRLRRTRPMELTIAQLSALNLLESSGGLTPRGLAEAERVQPPTMTRIVARLEELGLVRRTPHPTDGRQVILALSAAGQRLVAEYRRIADEWLARRLADLSDEDRAILRAAAEIIERLARDDGCHGGGRPGTNGRGAGRRRGDVLRG